MHLPFPQNYCLVLLVQVPVSPQANFAVAAEAAVAVGVVTIIAAAAPVEPGTQESVAAVGSCKVAQSLLRHALVQMNVRKSEVLVAEFLARSKVRFVVVVLV
jgi:hypothetical protein